MAKITRVRTCKEVSGNGVSYIVKYESGFVKEFFIDCENEKLPKTVESFIKKAENEETNKILGGTTYIFNVYTERTKTTPTETEPEQSETESKMEIDVSADGMTLKHCYKELDVDEYISILDRLHKARQEYLTRVKAETKPEFPDRFANVRFADDIHKQAFFEVLRLMNLKSDDVYRESLAYLITLDVVCREHIDSIYDFDECCINPDCLGEPWQTSTSRKTTFLAFNLFTSHSAWCPDDLKYLLTPDNIFCCTYAPYYWEAVKLRYPEYCCE